MPLTTLKCKLVAIQEGQYTNYVFEDLDKEFNSDLKYITCTKPPNWNYTEVINIGDIGYLQCEFVEAGINKWYSSNEKQFIPYKYTNCYFINFIKKKDIISTKEFNF